MSNEYTPQVLELIKAERDIQDERWGGLNHDRSHFVGEWIAILGEQYGDLCRTSIDVNTCLVHKNSMGYDELTLMLDQVIQVAAVATAMAELAYSALHPKPKDE